MVLHFPDTVGFVFLFHLFSIPTFSFLYFSEASGTTVLSLAPEAHSPDDIRFSCHLKGSPIFVFFAGAFSSPKLLCFKSLVFNSCFFCLLYSRCSLMALPISLMSIVAMFIDVALTSPQAPDPSLNPQHPYLGDTCTVIQQHLALRLSTRTLISLFSFSPLLQT